MRIIAAFSLILMIAWNYIANSGLLYDHLISNVSANWTNLFTPAVFTFAIWGLIYFLLVIFSIELFVNTKSIRILSDNTYKLIIMQSVLNALWIHCFMSSWLWMSFVILVLLCLVNFLIIIEKKGVVGWRNHAWSIYAGWTFVASIANASIALVSSGVDPNSEITYRITCIGAALVAAFIAVRINKYWIIFPIVWGLFGIAMNHYNEEGMYYAAMMSAFFLFLFALNRMVKSLRSSTSS